MEKILLSTLFVLFLIFIVFLILRELMCWYWKINKILSVLESIDAKLSYPRQSKEATGPVTMATSAPAGPIPQQGEEICPFCKEPTLKKYPICENCGRRKR